MSNKNIEKIKSAVSLYDMPIEDLEALRNKTVKNANQKMRRLERWAENHDKEDMAHPTKIKQFAYAKMVAENKRLYGQEKGYEKVKGSKEKDRSKLITQINKAQDFMQSPTSSGHGYTNKGLKTVNTLRERYGIEITVDDLYTFFDSPQFARFKDKNNFYTTDALIAIGNKQAELEKDNKTLNLKDWKEQFFYERVIKKVDKKTGEIEEKTVTAFKAKNFGEVNAQADLNRLKKLKNRKVTQNNPFGV